MVPKWIIYPGLLRYDRTQYLRLKSTSARIQHEVVELILGGNSDSQEQMSLLLDLGEVRA